jgi:hypothetical protein
VQLLFTLYMAHPDTVYNAVSRAATPATSARLFPLLLQQLAATTAAANPVTITTAASTANTTASSASSSIQCALGQQLVRAARELQCAGWESASSGSGDAPQLQQQQQQREHAAGVHATFLRDVAVRHPLVLLSCCSALAAVLKVSLIADFHMYSKR